MRRRLLTAWVVTGVVALTACTGGGGPDTDPTPTPSATPTAVDTGAVAVTSTLHLAAADVEVGVLPLVRAGEHVVLTLDLSMQDAGAGQVLLATAFSGTPVLQLPAMSGLRLFDLQRDVVHTVAEDADGRTVTTGQDYVALRAGESLRLQVAYAAPPDDVTSLGLFLPGGPYVPAVPVVEGEVPSPALAGAGADAVDPLNLDVVAEAPVVPLESFTAELAGAVQTLTTTEEVQVTLGSDVLFEVDSDELGPDATDALDTAVKHLEGREAGTVHVVGHTDDVASDSYNQDLSERRARAVAEALEQRIDTDRFTLEAEGRGESEPVIAKTDDDSRALNRRVTLTLVSEITETVDVTTEGELPPFDAGPVGTGAEGVMVTSVGTYRITAPQARRVDGHIVLDLQVGPVDEAAEVGVSFLSGIWHYRGEMWSVQRSASGVVLLRGATAVYPMDHFDAVAESGNEQWLPATDFETLGEIAPGEARTFSVVYPDVGDLDEIAVQVHGGLGTVPFRLTDIPVVD